MGLEVDLGYCCNYGSTGVGTQVIISDWIRNGTAHRDRRIVLTVSAMQACLSLGGLSYAGTGSPVFG